MTRAGGGFALGAFLLAHFSGSAMAQHPAIGDACGLDDGRTGSCQLTRECGDARQSIPGRCAGPSNVQCCVPVAAETGEGLRITVFDPNHELRELTVTLRDPEPGTLPRSAPIIVQLVPNPDATVIVRSEGDEAEPPLATPLRSGLLSMITTPWSEVYLDGRRLGSTPLIEVELPAGDYVLELRNPEEAIRTLHPVRIVEGTHARIRIALR